jgi:choice-of-anchor A domain-containing protein
MKPIPVGSAGRGLLFVCFFTCAAQAATIGNAAYDNIFAFDSISYSGGTIGGAVAAGNSITLAGISTAFDEYPSGNTRVVVLSGGTVNLSNGSINGSVQYASSPSSNTATLPPGATFLQASSPYDFAAEQLAYRNFSNQLAGLPANGTVAMAFGTLTFSGGPSAGLYVFDIQPAQTTATSLMIDLPAGSTAIINVTGSASYNYGGFSAMNGLDATDLLWNGPTATDVSIAGVAFQGTILAPNASVDLTNGTLTGQVIANSVTGAGHDLSYAKFDGPIPPPPATSPEPSSAVLIVLGILLIAVRLALKRFPGNSLR